MRTKPAIGDKVYIKGYATLTFEVVAHQVGKQPVVLQHPISGGRMAFALRELEAQP